MRRNRKSQGPAGPAGLLLEPVIGLAAAPDRPTRARMATLTATVAAPLQGRAGSIVGYDRGDPAHTLGGPVQGAPSPTVGIADVRAGSASVYTPQTTFQDAPLTNPQLDPYNALLLARMHRS